jgi:hypothetical protein
MRKTFTIITLILLVTISFGCTSGQGRYLPITSADGFQGTFDTQTGEYYYVNDPINPKDAVYGNPVKEVKAEESGE